MNKYKFYSAQGYSPGATNTRHAKMAQAYSVVERSSEVLRLQSSLEDELLLTRLKNEIVNRRLRKRTEIIAADVNIYWLPNNQKLSLTVGNCLARRSSLH